MNDQDISNFCAITAATPEVARSFLEMANNDLENAVQLFFDNPDLQASLSAAAPAASSGASASARDVAGSSRTPPVPPANTRPFIGRQDERGVIHLDSDDDEDAPMTVDDDDEIRIPSDDDEDDADQNATAMAAAVARNAQEDEDAAFAKRMQEQLYAENTEVPGDVRSPIARTTETLVGPGSYTSGRVAEDVDAMSFIQQQMQARMAGGSSRARGNPFNHNLSIWDDSSAPRPAGSSAENGTRAQRLAELFRPPYDLMARLDWDEARQEGKDAKKWILVNLQDMSDFNCQALNRDIWKDAAIKELVREHFIFLQYDKAEWNAQQYITFYFPGASHENPDNYPHVAIIDPRTGEQVKAWSGRPFPPARDFHSQLVEFLDRYSLDDNSRNPVAKQPAQRPKTVDVDRMTEEEMLEMALQNSLETANGSSSTPKTNVLDPDALTKSPGFTAGGSAAGASNGKDKAPVDTSTAAGELATPPDETPARSSVFASISSGNPHTEPENNPATTTRIQLRHPTGRVIRRFRLQDPVRRVYEWLKAEPLEGKEGIEFELKRMPQGTDLIDDVDKTIEEVGLKQGTILVEFIQD